MSFVITLILALDIIASATNTIPVGQDVGSLQREVKEIKEKESASKDLIKGKEEVEIKERSQIIPDIKETNDTSEKILIKEITVLGYTLISIEKMYDLISPYENRELSFQDFNEVARIITEEYRKNGYATSFAYLPPQKIESNTLTINVMEGRIGDINLTGNKYFKESILLKYLDVRKNKIFNYDELRQNINYINEHPDRSAKIILDKGKNQGQTDINVSIKDRIPLHVTLGYNNYNSDFLDNNKYMLELKSTNFLGLDHQFFAELQRGGVDQYELYSGRYLIPLSPRTKVGAVYMRLDQELGGSVNDLDIQGTGDIGQIYLTHKFIENNNFALSLNAGFDYKDIENTLLGLKYSKDNMRVVKMGFDMDIMDNWGGRSILVQEFNYGIEDIMGGLEKKDPASSRLGAGGRFFKSVSTLARIQSLPHDTSVMLKGSAQLTGYNLVSTEQFNIGGFTSVRGYPVSEYAGDRGYVASIEYYVPPYFLSKSVKIPKTNINVYDSLRFMIFFDWGQVKTKNPQVGESSAEEIFSVGPALRFNIPEKFSVSFDYGFVLGQEATDGSDSRGYVEAKLFF